jgi:antitoxin (DNA-binding transcriptional repressor) of toxin-antitoxin stability system
MSDRETGVEEARKVLGKLVDDAALDGTVTYLTRRGRRHAAIVPLDRIKEPAVPETTYTAAIASHSSVVIGDFCDVSVAENVIATYREDEDGNEIPVYEMGSNVVLDPQKTTVRTDEDEFARLESEAEAILTENGWRITGPWEVADTAMYAPVERA